MPMSHQNRAALAFLHLWCCWIQLPHLILIAGGKKEKKKHTKKKDNWFLALKILNTQEKKKKVTAWKSSSNNLGISRGTTKELQCVWSDKEHRNSHCSHLQVQSHPQVLYSQVPQQQKFAMTKGNCSRTAPRSLKQPEHRNRENRALHFSGCSGAS